MKRLIPPATTIITILLALAPAAHAAITHTYLPAPSQALPNGVPESCPLEHCITGPLTAVSAMTADSGHLFIAEKVEGTGSTRTDEFDDATGAFIQQLPQDPLLASLDAGVAVAHTTGLVYDAGAEGIAVYSPTEGLKATWKGETAGTLFGSLHGVGVDNSTGHWSKGDLAVLNGNEKAVDILKPKNGFEEPAATEAVLTGTCENPGEVATGLLACPGSLTKAAVPFTNPLALSVSAANGDLLIADEHAANVDVVDVFEPTGTNELTFVRQLTGTPNGAWEHSETLPVQRRVSRIAAGAGGDIYVVEKVIRVEGATEYLIDQFNGEGKFVGRLSGTPAGPFKQIEEVEGSVAVDPVSGDVFVGSFEAAGFVDVFGADLVIPDVAAAPVTSFQVDPTAHTWATVLGGTVNPLSALEGASCEFEYGVTLAYGQHAKCEPPTVAQGNTPAPVESVQVTGLQPDTTYFFRLDASNKNGISTGLGPEDEASFTTPGPGVVSESAAAVASSSATLQATIVPHEQPASPRAHPVSYFFEYGPTTTYGPPTPTVTVGPGETPLNIAQHIQSLTAATEYHYRVVTVAEVETAGTIQVQQFPGADHTFTTQPPSTPESSGAGGLPDHRQWELVSPPDKRGALILAPGAGAQKGGGLVQAAADGSAISYVTDAPTESAPRGSANDLQVLSRRGPAGWGSRDIAVAHRGATGFAIGQTIGSEYRFFSEDLALSVVQPFGGFDPAVSPEASEQTPYERNDFTGNSICPSAAQEAEGASCYEPLLTGKQPFADVTSGLPFSTQEGECPPEYKTSICAPEFVNASPDAQHVLLHSQNGQRVALTGAPGDQGGLYEWSAAASPAQRLVLVSVLSEGKDAPTVAGGEVSEDGSLVFFVDGERLYMRDVPLARTIELGGVGAGFEGVFASAGGHRVLFAGEECDVRVSGAGELECPVVGVGTGAGGSLLGASNDGSVLYFTSHEALTGSEANGRGEVAQPGQSNLYVRAHGTVELIAVLTPGSTGNARVSPDGGWLAFASDRSLTGYDNRDAHTGIADSEVYVFSRASNTLVCASCDPSGARPQGPSSVPGLTGPAEAIEIYQPRYLSDSGRLFFDSSDALVPQDVNGTGDVYEWEPAGVPEGPDACSNSTAGYSSVTGGCLGLISSGTSSEESLFLDASETGGDVFFLTTSRLSPQDTDTSYDVYDAQECTSVSPCVAQPAAQPSVCATADSCRAVPTPQPEVFGAPSSSTFSGPGNTPPPPPPAKKPTLAQQLAAALKSCRAKQHSHRNKRVACERAARKRYAAKKASLHAKTTRRR